MISNQGRVSQIKDESTQVYTTVYIAKAVVTCWSLCCLHCLHSSIIYRHHYSSLPWPCAMQTHCLPCKCCGILSRRQCSSL